MNIVIGSDHGGYEMKEKLKKYVQGLGHTVIDFGCPSLEAVDYPDIAVLVCEAVRTRQYDRGILLDGTGGGVCMTANKVPGIRAVLAYNEVTGKYASEHDNANILCLGGKMLGEIALQEIVKAWLSTPFGGGRHERRLQKVEAIEKKYGG